MTLFADVPPVDEASRFCPVSDEVNAAPTPVATPRSRFLRFSMINLSTRWTLRFHVAKQPSKIWELSRSQLVAKLPNRIDRLRTRSGGRPSLQIKVDLWGTLLRFRCTNSSVYCNPASFLTQLHYCNDFTKNKSDLRVPLEWVKRAEAVIFYDYRHFQADSSPTPSVTLPPL